MGRFPKNISAEEKEERKMRARLLKAQRQKKWRSGGTAAAKRDLARSKILGSQLTGRGNPLPPLEVFSLGELFCRPSSQAKRVLGHPLRGNGLDYQAGAQLGMLVKTLTNFCSPAPSKRSRKRAAFEDSNLHGFVFSSVPSVKEPIDFKKISITRLILR